MSDVLVLCYHAISETWESELAVTPSQLERQLTGVIRKGYRPMPFLDAVSSPHPEPVVAVTFDDACLSVRELAFPILNELGAVGSVYAPTDWIGRDQPMSWQGIDQWTGTDHEAELLPMSWDDLGALCEQGWEVGSHTCSHPHLTELDDVHLADELERSRARCAEGLGEPCTTIAYPYGDVDDRVVVATANAGYAAAGALPAAPHATDALRWPRVGIYRWDNAGRFRLKTSPLVRKLRAAPVRRLLAPVGRLTRSAPGR